MEGEAPEITIGIAVPQALDQEDIAHQEVFLEGDDVHEEEVLEISLHFNEKII